MTTLALETKWALLRAALGAQRAGEETITANRIAESLLRTDSMREFCSRAGIVFEELDDPPDVDFDSPVDSRPMESTVRRVLDPIIEEHGAIAISPLELLRELMRAEPALAQRLGPLEKAMR